MWNLEKFILVEDDYYIINLNSFISGDDFSSSLLEFLAKFAKKSAILIVNVLFIS